MKRILVTGAGGAPGANFIASLRLVKEESLYIVGADINKYHLELTEGLDAKYILPTVDSSDYLDKLNEINTHKLKGKRLRIQLLLQLKEKAGLTYPEIHRIPIFSELKIGSMGRLFKRVKEMEV
jgi:hypothetical protein